MALEHMNRLLKNIIRMLGPNASNRRAVDRYCKALAANKDKIESWDRSSSFIAQSGKHKVSDKNCDMKKLIKNLWTAMP